MARGPSRCKIEGMSAPGSRLLRRVTSWLVTLAFLVPVLLQVLPSPVSAAEAALWRDVQVNRCLDQGLPVPDQPKSCADCVLCVAPGLPRAANLPDLLADPIDRQVVPERVSYSFLHMERARPDASTAPITGRGPPA